MKTCLLLLLLADFSAIDAAVEAEMKAANVPGAAIVIVREGAIVYEKGYGVTSADDPHPVTPQTLFRLGSTTKMFVAMAASKLQAEGKLDFAKPIATYASGLHPKIGRLTMEQLLTHTAGLRDEAPMNGPRDEGALAERVRRWDESMFFTEQGEVFSYSNPGYVLAGYVIAEIAKKPFGEAMVDLVLRPLAMNGSTFRPIEAMTRPLALGHDPQGKVIRPFAEDASNYPPGSLFTSAHELAPMLNAMLARSDLATPRAAIPAIDRAYGYGIELRTDRGVAITGHTGARAGYGSIVWLIPAKKIGIAILANRTGAIFFAAMRKTVETLVEVRDESAPARALPTIDVQRWAGKYVNGAFPEVELTTGGTLRIGGREHTIEQIGEKRFRARGAAQLETFAIVETNNATYIAADHWALRRKEN